MKKKSSLHRNKSKLTTLWDSIDEPVYVSHPKTYRVLYANKAIENTHGRTIGKKCYEAFQGLNKPCPFCTNKHIFGKNLGKTHIWEVKNSLNGDWYHCIDKAITWTDGEWVRYEMAINITDRKKAEEALAISEKKYRTVVENANEGIIIAQHDKLLLVNEKIPEYTGYKKEELLNKTFLEFVHPKDRSKIKRLSECVLNGTPKRHSDHFRILEKNGNLRWVKCNSVIIEWGSKPAVISFLTDITEQQKVEAQLEESLEKLKRAVEGNIKAMAIAAEMRDPYTAGHQRRVSKLARAIAMAMKLPKKTVEGIRVAATLHDIGKMRVPVEILSKPRKLTDIEMDFIKTHPLAGYNILKAEEFSWPIADIVLQHHERMNGTGYPRGLTGDKILLEAKILAVADVVEAMASHRPYRPALGIKKALEEIRDNCGKLYDTRPVKACIDLFSKKGFSLER
jgi:PAS domain S-box-containing protein/putative nucleotidyltransferase with HDIG domain